MIIEALFWGRGGGGTCTSYVFPLTEFKNVFFHILREKPYPCRYFSFVFAYHCCHNIETHLLGLVIWIKKENNAFGTYDVVNVFQMK